MKLMRVQDAVGQVLCHDITQIIPGVTKDAVFRKGHIIREEDIPVLLSVGKEHIYIWEKDVYKRQRYMLRPRPCRPAGRSARGMPRTRSPA